MEDNRSYESLVGGGFDGSIFEHIVSVENLFSAWREFKKGKTKNRIIKKSAKLLLDLQEGKITKERLSQSISSYLGHMGHTKSRKTKYFLHMVRAKTRNLPESI